MVVCAASLLLSLLSARRSARARRRGDRPASTALVHYDPLLPTTSQAPLMRFPADRERGRRAAAAACGRRDRLGKRTRYAIR